jgi:hypothetical protein
MQPTAPRDSPGLRSFIPSDRPDLSRSISSCEPCDSWSNGGCSTPDSEASWMPKNVRFHEKVEQCIALAHFGEDDQEYDYDSDVMMIRKIRQPFNATKHQFNSKYKRRNVSPSKTIEKLPHAPLKSPEPQQEESLGSAISKHRPLLTHVVDGLFGEEIVIEELEDEEEDDEEDEYCEPPRWLHGRKNSIQMFQEKLEKLGAINGLQKDDSVARDLPCESPLSPMSMGRNSSSITTFETPSFRSKSSAFPFPSFGNTTSHVYNDNAEDESYWSADIDFCARTESDFSPRSSDSEPLSVVAPLSAAKAALVNRVMAEFWVVFNKKDYARSLVPVVLSTPPSLQPRRRTWSLSSTVSPSSPTLTGESPIARALAQHEQSLRQTLPLFVRNKVVALVRDEQYADEADIMERLSAIIQDCQDKVLASYQADAEHADDYISGFTEPLLIQKESSGGRPGVGSIDSGYGTDQDRVRDVRDVVEKEKGIQDWELYASAWDDDEAAAWESSF